MKMLKGWTIYHLSFVGVFVAMGLFLGVNALLVSRDGGYSIESEATLPFDSMQLWAWVTDNEKRSKWQVGMYDLARLTGEPEEPESTRMLFFQSGRDKWTGVEATLEAKAPTLWRSRQEMTRTSRLYTITLKQEGKCRTIVTVKEKAQLFDFNERFWMFWDISDHQKRLDYSLRQLRTWMGHKNEVCEIG